MTEEIETFNKIGSYIDPITLIDTIKEDIATWLSSDIKIEYELKRNDRYKAKLDDSTSTDAYFYDMIIRIGFTMNGFSDEDIKHFNEKGWKFQSVVNNYVKLYKQFKRISLEQLETDD